LQSTVPASQLGPVSTRGALSFTEPSVCGPPSTLLSGDSESLDAPSVGNVASLVMIIVSSDASATAPESLELGAKPEPPQATSATTPIANAPRLLSLMGTR
jgi:hypothetical protein